MKQAADKGSSRPGVAYSHSNTKGIKRPDTDP